MIMIMYEQYGSINQRVLISHFFANHFWLADS